MLKKSLLALALLMPLAALSATAQAGSTITDKSYWPSESRQTAQGGTGVWRADLNSAFAYHQRVSRLHAATDSYAVEPAWRYQGGPKSH
jgi:hypothetical protein